LFCVGFVGYYYLSRSDHVTVEVAEWVNANTDTDDIILYQPRHAAAVMDYQHQPLLSRSTGRRTWIWTRSTQQWEKDRAATTSDYVVITHPPLEVGGFERLRQQFKGPGPKPSESVVEAAGLGGCSKIHDTEVFTVYSLTDS
jgi:hypothetical protein